MNRRKIKIGSRGSRLALVQAEYVKARLAGLNPGIEFNIMIIATSGDKDRRTSLEKMADIGVFVKELEEALADRRIDLAVHSLKDMPTIVPPELILVATTEREDPRDALVTRGETLAGLKLGAVIGTGSLRRSVQISRFRNDVEIKSIRGNMDTRLRKVSEGELDGLIVAAAAMARLGLLDKITEYLAPEYFVPSVGQGALGIEIRRSDEDIAAMVSGINHLPTWQAIVAERSFLEALGGGCRAPIAALAEVHNGAITISGMAASEDGKLMKKAMLTGAAVSAEDLGRQLASDILRQGAGKFLPEVKKE
ncbi:hydroxymethylbilane synthase [Chloroflexota bacterium]